ncbi:MAG: hypothetical protein AAF483_31005 [Planctomycetota bacterium]
MRFYFSPVQFSVCALVCCLTVLLCGSSTLANNKEKTKTVKARSLELKVPSDWKETTPTSSMRAAQFSAPKSVDVVVFYFGGPTGGVAANVERWIGQFKEDGLETKMTQGKCTAGSYILIDCKGTWNKPDGPPFAQKTIAAPNSQVLNVIVVEEKAGKPKDYYFLKVSGSAEAVGKQAKNVRTMIGADIEKEKEFKLEDAEK